MKKLLLAVVVLTSFVLQGYSQNKKLVLPEAQYQDLKSRGMLEKNINYLPVPDVHPTPVVQKQVTPQTPKSTAGACSCYITPDGTYTLAMAPNDDGSSSLITIPFNFCLYGTNYTTLYINNNGNVSFGAPYGTYNAVGFPDPTYVMVAPFWGDVDTRGTGTVQYKITPTAMYVNWDHVGYYSTMTNLLNTFQLIITDGTDPILPTGSNIAFCYGDMQWTTGAASCGGGSSCTYGGNTYACIPFCGYPATVGANKGDGINYFQMGRFDHPGIDYDGGYGSNDGVSWLDYQSLYFNSCASTNIPPIASGLNNCDTIRICGSGDTLFLNGLFLSPEIGQITNLSINLNGTPNATIISNTSGNAANGIVQIIANSLNAGNNIITFTATDNGIPVGTTVVSVNVFVDTTNLTNFNPVISGNLEFCDPGTSLLTVTPGTYDSYVWNTGAFGTSITVDTTGIYYCTASLNGCYKSTSVNVISHLPPTPTITGATFTCNGNPTIIYLDSSFLYTSYTWSNFSTNDSLGTSGGTYTITVTDSNGCTGTSPPLTVTSLVPTSTITTGTVPFCPGDSVGLTANPTPATGATFVWNNSQTTQTIQATSAGTYTVIVNYLANGCADTTSVNVTTYDVPNASFSSNPNGTSGPYPYVVQFSDLSTVPIGSITSWTWNFGDSTNVFHYGPNPSHSYAVNGTYLVTLIVCTNNGCCDSTEFPYIIVSDIESPNVMTPNAPGASQLNNHLYFKNLEYFPGTKLLVYNRWGNKVYENDDYTKYQKDTYGWDGGTHTDGVYYYVLDGPLFKEPKYGFVQILR